MPAGKCGLLFDLTMKEASLHRYYPGRFEDNLMKGDKLVLPPGQKQTMQVKQNVPDSLYLAQPGIDAISLTGGQNTQDYTRQFGTPARNMKIFLSSPIPFMGHRPNKKFNEWDESDISSFIFGLKASIGGWPQHYYFATEAYDASWDWRPGADYANWQYRKLCELWAADMAKEGKILWGNYGGNLEMGWRIDENRTSFINRLGAACETPSKALALLKEIEYPETAYFGNELWKYGMGCTSHTYWLNTKDTYRFIFETRMNMKLHRMAMSAPEVTKKQPIASYYMKIGRQLIGYGMSWPNQPTAAGLIRGGYFPPQSYASAVLQGRNDWMDVDYRIQWDDSRHWGTDYSVLSPLDSDLNFRPNGQPYTTKFAGYTYQPEGSGIAPEPYGILGNSTYDAARWHNFAYQLTGTRNYTLCRHRRAGTNKWFEAGYDGECKRFLAQEPIFYRSEGNGQIVIWGVTPQGEGSERGKYLTHEVETNSGYETLELPPNYCSQWYPKL